MERWFVTIDHLTDEQLSFFGFTLVLENDEFKVYRHYSGEDHIVRKAGPRFLLVDDINDAVAMAATRVLRAKPINDDE